MLLTVISSRIRYSPFPGIIMKFFSVFRSAIAVVIPLLTDGFELNSFLWMPQVLYPC